MVKIAVEEPLTDVKQELNRRGFTTEMLDRKTDAADYDVIVVRDKEDMADMHMNAQLVEVKGRSVNEVVEKVGDHLRRAGKLEVNTKMKKKKAVAGKGFLNGVAVGTIVGATAGLLIAPTEGKTTRKNITTKSTQTKDKTTEMINKVKDTKGKATGMLNKSKEKAPGSKKDDTTTEIAPKESVQHEPTNLGTPEPGDLDTPNRTSNTPNSTPSSKKSKPNNQK